MRQFEAEIVDNRVVAESWRELTLAWDEDAGEPKPGQFLMLRVSPFNDPLLRRPLAFSSYSRAQVSAIYQIRGGATRLLSELSPGSRIDVIAPLGIPFPLPARGEIPVLAGGGIGLGPLLYLADVLSAADRTSAADAPAGAMAEPRPVAAPTLVLGFRSADLIPSIDLPAGAIICTDDGSFGFKGSPVDWISHNAPKKNLRIYGCGPAPMLAALAALAAERGWPASLSAEQWMACGVGACMGCALPRADGKGYVRACSDGPVFEASTIDWRPR